MKQAANVSNVPFFSWRDMNPTLLYLQFVANMLGTSLYTGCVFSEHNGAILENTIGQGWLQGGELYARCRSCT